MMCLVFLILLLKDKIYCNSATGLFQDSFIMYDTKEKIEEYKKFLAEDGTIDVSTKSATRKGWTNIPFGVPEGTVVTHASLNIGSWVIYLCAKMNM